MRYRITTGGYASWSPNERVSLVRYLARPPFAEAQLEWLDDERLQLTFRSPTRAGQSSVVLGRVQLLRRLLWLIAPPRQHQVRYAGVLAPAAKLRPRVTPACQGSGHLIALSSPKLIRHLASISGRRFSPIVTTRPARLT